MNNKVVETDAVQYVMDNVFDWAGQQKHAGLRMTFEDSRKLVRSLQKNLEATCPDVRDARVLDLYGDLVHNHWVGELDDVKVMTRRVVVAYMESEYGSPDMLAALKREMAGKIKFMETHYRDAGHGAELPLHVAAEVMDKNEKAESIQGAQRLSDSLNQMRSIIDSKGEGEANFARRKFPGLFKLMGR